MVNQLQNDDAEYVTFIETSIADMTRELQAQGLSGSDYAIVHRMGSHRFTIFEGEMAEQLLEGRRMIAATFARRRKPERTGGPMVSLTAAQ